jgi:23S rRNA (adenine2503-C2)-methyltransferase
MKEITLTGLFPEEISALLPGNKETYRGMQIFRWIHEHCATSFEEMTNLPKSFREEIKNQFTIGALKIIDVLSSSDGTTHKYLWELRDGYHIESVIIRDEGRTTACISSQIGCKMGCSFCRTAKMGFIRNLSTGEIMDQLIQMRRLLRDSGEDLTNIVFMGMGDPLDNVEAVIKAIRIITMETALSIGQRKITVSTCGIIPGIPLLAHEFKRIGLAISLNAPDNTLRSKLMPVNRRYPLDKLLDAAHDFTRKTKRRVTFEYILIDNVNDSPNYARKLLSIARRIPSKVNIITFNEFEGCPFKRPSDEKIEAFQKILFEGNVTALLRKSKGTDICAACGLLASKKK